MSKSWSGEPELSAALAELSRRPENDDAALGSAVRHAISVSRRLASDFKHVVHAIERWIRRASSSEKLGGMMVLDGLVRIKTKERDTYAKRFSLRLKETFTSLGRLSTDDNAAIISMVEEWLRRECFNTELLSSLPLGDNVMSNLLPASAFTPAAPVPTATSTSDVATTNNTAPTLVRRAVRLCAFRDNCPFGNSCRFAHYDSTAPGEQLAQYTLRLRTTAPHRIVAPTEDSDLTVMEMMSGLIPPGNLLAEYGESKASEEYAPLNTADLFSPRFSWLQCAAIQPPPAPEKPVDILMKRMYGEKDNGETKRRKPDPTMGRIVLDTPVLLSDALPAPPVIATVPAKTFSQIMATKSS